MVQYNHVIISTIFYHLQSTTLYMLLRNSTPRRWLQILLLALHPFVWILTYSTILFQAFLTVAILLQPWNFILPKSTLTSSSNLSVSLPVFLTVIGLYSVTIFTLPSLSIFTIRPIHTYFIYVTISANFIRKSTSSLFLILELPSLFKMAIYNSRNIQECFYIQELVQFVCDKILYNSMRCSHIASDKRIQIQ